VIQTPLVDAPMDSAIFIVCKTLLAIEDSFTSPPSSLGY